MNSDGRSDVLGCKSVIVLTVSQKSCQATDHRDFCFQVNSCILVIYLKNKSKELTSIFLNKHKQIFFFFSSFFSG